MKPSFLKKGRETACVQRQHCGAAGKIENCVVSVHLGYAVAGGGPRGFHTLLDGELYLPEQTWHDDRERCREAGVPDDVVYRSKHQIAFEQYQRAVSNGVRFAWMTFDEFYGRSRDFLRRFEACGPDYRGIVCSDFFSAYRKFVAEGDALAAYCWAHLIRDIRYLTTLSDKVIVNWASKLLGEAKRLFRACHRHGERARQNARDAIHQRVRRPPRRGEARTLAERIKTHAPAYFRFLDDPRVEPTNNKAERALRHAVIDRRITQGTRGEAGSRWLERFLSVRETCRQQGRPLFDYTRCDIFAGGAIALLFSG